MEIIKVRSAPFGNRQSAVFKTILILFLKQLCSSAGGSSRIKKSKIKKNELALQEIPKSLLLLFIYEYTLNKPIGSKRCNFEGLFGTVECWHRLWTRDPGVYSQHWPLLNYATSKLVQIWSGGMLRLRLVTAFSSNDILPSG